MDISNDPRKIIKAFYSVGLNESKITKYDEDIELKYVKKIDIVEKVIDTPLDEILIDEDEKWYEYFLISSLQDTNSKRQKLLAEDVVLNCL